MENFQLHDLTILRQMIEKGELDQPLLFTGIHREWEPCLWSLDMWKKLLAKDNPSEELICRIGQVHYSEKEPQWESKSKQIGLSWDRLTGWCDPSHWACYDYKNVVDVIDQKYLEKFEWSRLGFPEKAGQTSNLWIGSKGSYTPCHYDTYGCNLVTQVYGRKTWILFPPNDTIHLHPTRLPYEESSVYSSINFTSVSPSYYNDLTKCHPLRVQLEPGDVLFVPHNWWHFVKSDEFSISVNIWLDQNEDDLARVQEAMVRFLVGSFVSVANPDSVIEILNPNEEDLAVANEQYLSNLLELSYQKYEKAKQQRTSEPTAEVPNKGVSMGEPVEKKSRATILRNFLATYPFIKRLSEHNFDFEHPGNTQIIASESQASEDSLPQQQKLYKHLINAISHPEILNQICEQYFKNIENDK